MAKRAEIVGLYPENGWDYDSIESILKSRTSIKGGADENLDLKA